mmetsp:Transcript_49168/g.91473  ORF Transcript_49168/g.91473 Transcript_49168/m.91473 type:complete len:925 (+) Transcript_49168:45-2819(+)
MPPKKKLSAVGTKKGMFSSHKLVMSPYGPFCGSKIDLPGSWWPTATAAEKEKIYKVVLFRIVPNWVPAVATKQPGSKQDGFELRLVDAADPSFTAAEDVSVPDSNTWIVDRIEFSRIYFDQEKKNEEALALAAAEAEEEGNVDSSSSSSSSSSGVAESPLPKGVPAKNRTSDVWKCFKDVRPYEKKGGGFGMIMECTLGKSMFNGEVNPQVRYSGSTKDLKSFLRTHFLAEYLKLFPETEHPDGKPYTYLEDKWWEQNRALLNVITDRALPNSFGEAESVRGWAKTLDPRASLCRGDTMGRLNLARSKAVKEKKREHLDKLHGEGIKVSTQLDMWMKGGISYGAVNYTWTDVEVVDVSEEDGLPDLRPSLVLKSDVLDFNEFPDKQHTGVNVANWYLGVLDEFGLVSDDIVIVVPDGASNCLAAMDELERRADLADDHFESTTCYCHQIGRATLHGVGLGGKLANSRNIVLRAVLELHRRLAAKFHTTPSLKAGLSEEQLDAGVDKPLTTVRGVVTRWNGYWSAVQRNNRLMPFIEAALESSGRVNVFAETEDGVVQDGEEGEDGEVKPLVLNEVEGSSLLPTLAQRKIGRQFEALGKPLFDATQQLQGLRTSGDETYPLMWRVHEYYKNPPSVHQVKAAMTSSGEPPALIDVQQAHLDENIKLFQEVTAGELHERFIAPGPSVNQLLCMYLNPSMRKSKHQKYLTATQRGSMKMHATNALREQAALRSQCPTSSSSSSASSSSSSSSLFSPLSSSASDGGSAKRRRNPCEESDSDEDEPPVVEVTAAATPVIAPWVTEQANYDNLVDFSVGICGQRKFNPLVFWANPSIVKMFPLLSAVARSQFSGIPHEATSERTFSFSGRTCSDLRGSMAIEQVCAHVVANAGHKHRPITVAEIRGHYESKGVAKKRMQDAAAAASSPSLA